MGVQEQAHQGVHAPQPLQVGLKGKQTSEGGQGLLSPLAVLWPSGHHSAGPGTPLRSFPASHFTGPADHQPCLRPDHTFSYFLPFPCGFLWLHNEVKLSDPKDHGSRWAGEDVA